MGQVAGQVFCNAPSIVSHILRSVDYILFSKGSLGSALEAQTQQMRAAVESEPEENLKQADGNMIYRKAQST